LSVPGTDNLYHSFFFAPNTAAANPKPETTDNFDVGVRYRGPQIQAQLGAFYNRYKDRTASAFDPELNVSVFRNLGRVDKYGLDGYVSYQPVKQLNLYVFGSYLKSEIKDDLLTGECNAAQVTAKFPGCTTVGQEFFAPTAGKREAGAPKYTFGGTARGTLGPLELGITAKRTGERFVFDTNEPTFAGSVLTPAGITQIFPAAAPAYWLVNLDARYSLASVGLDRTHIQLNVYNLFDQFYVGGFGGNLNQSITTTAGATLGNFGNPSFVQIGAPRTVSATLTVGF
jgi:iron complex outermembrane receptor protein